jgi:hypothetical protein
VALPCVLLSRAPTAAYVPRTTRRTTPITRRRAYLLTAWASRSPSGERRRAVLACRCEAARATRSKPAWGNSKARRCKAKGFGTPHRHAHLRGVCESGCDRAALAPHRPAKGGSSPTAPRPATKHRRRSECAARQPEPAPREHPSGLHKMLVEAPALVPAFTLPAGDGALVQREGRDDGLNRAAIRHPGYDGDHQLVRLVCPVECSPFGFAESLGAPLALVAALFSAPDHDVSLARSAVGPATSGVAVSFVRVHARILAVYLFVEHGAGWPLSHRPEVPFALSWTHGLYRIAQPASLLHEG